MQNGSLIHRLSRYLKVIAPSGVGLVLYVLIASLTLFIYHLHILLGYFNIHGSLLIGSYLLDHINSILVRIFGNNNTNVVVLAFFWGSVGLVVYFLITLLASDVTELSEDLYERKKFIWPKKPRHGLVGGFFEKIILRLALIFILIFYCGHVFSFFLHDKITTLNIFGSSISRWLSMHDLYKGIAFFLAEILALHGLTIILRLILLKPRLIG